MRKTIMALGLLAWIMSPAFSVTPAGAFVDFTNFSHVPGPELDAPCTDDFDLQGGDTLLFRWRPVLPARLRHYVFRLYRGYQTRDADLIMKRTLPAASYSFPLPARGFSKGQVYTWTLTGVFLDGSATDKSFCSFQIIHE